MSALDKFSAWAIAAKPGQRYEYHRGYVANQICAIRSAVVAAYLSGDFDLVQQRHGPDDYSYFIVRRAKRDTERREWIIPTKEAGRIHRLPKRVAA